MGGRGVRRAIAAAVSLGLLAACSPLESDVRSLASDDLGGRNNGTAGSVKAQDYIIDRLDDFAVGIDPTKQGADAFRVPLSGGTNVIGVIPGRDLADQFVVVGAHYDHLGSCRTADPADTICNGATDNAAGVAALLNVAEQLARGQGPRRSVVLALWDREEDGLLGSRAYVAGHFADPTVMQLKPEHGLVSAYINVDGGRGPVGRSEPAAAAGDRVSSRGGASQPLRAPAAEAAGQAVPVAE